MLARHLFIALLLATLAHASHAFSNPGTPPDYVGMWTGEGSDGPLTGIVTEESNGFKFVHVDEGGQLSIQTGNFTSWECVTPGVVQYDLTWTLQKPDGTSVTEEHCELAEVDLQEGTWRWASAVWPDCPQNITDAALWGTEYLVNSTLSNTGKAQVC